MNDEMYYIVDNRGTVGNSLSFWGPNRRGYTCKLEKAGLYSKEEAFSIHKNRETDLPFPQSLIKSVCTRQVDHQDMPRDWWKIK
jgi:hypothetical protein